MDNDPNNQSSGAPEEPKLSTDSQMTDVNSTPNFDQEPATGGFAADMPTSSDPSPEVNVPKENPVSASSPFGPPIENLGTQPDFGPTSSVSPVLNSSSSTDMSSSKPISDIAPPTPVATPNILESSSPVEPVPVVAPVPVGNSNQVVDEKKAAKDGKKTFIKLPKQKKSHKGLIALLIILVVIIGGLVGGYFYVKTSADTAASNYTTKAKTYLNEVYNIATSDAVTDPAALKSKIDGVSKPILEKPLLSDIDFISSNYAEAGKLNSQVVAQVSALNATLLDLSDTYTFVVDYEALSKEATTVSGTVTSDSTKAETLKMLADYQVVLEKMQTLVDGVTLPDTLKDVKSDLKTALTDEITATKSQITALTADNDTDYKQAKTDLATAASKEMSSMDSIKKVSSEVPGQIKSAANVLKAFLTSIKS